MKKDSKLFFIPGGPWISGSYWDPFIKKYFENVPTERIVLTNHENNYEINNLGTISQQLNEISDKISHESSSINLIGHSYGALLSLLLLEKIPPHRINKVILVCLPFSNRRSPVIAEFLKDQKIDLDNNQHFSDYFRLILKFYFSPGFNYMDFDWLTKNSYMIGNENLLLNDSLMKESISIAQKNEKNISFIFAENDQVLGNLWPNYVSTNTSIIKNSGHFPMLEQPELFSKILNSVLA